jgi:hypothetical protein
MILSSRVASAVSSALSEQGTGLDALVGVTSVVIEVHLKPGGPDDVNIRPQMKSKVDLR